MTATVSSFSRHIGTLADVTSPVVAFMTQSTWARRQGEPGIADLVVGNPHEPPLPGVVSALGSALVPRSNDWFGYQMSQPAACAAAASGLESRLGVAFEADDVLLTTGAFAGLAVTLRTLIDPGDEVVYISPPWFFYDALIAAAGASSVRVRAMPPSFDLDVAAIAAALTPRTRAVIVNSPNNPTGRIYPATALRTLATVLQQASDRFGRRIYILSDEAYSRIVFSGAEFVSPTRFYPWTVLIYTYGKTLLTPGQRLGYLALPTSMPSAERAALRQALTLAQVVTGYAYPNAVLQYALPELEQLSIDVGALQRKRDHVVSALRSYGYSVECPEATFYVLAKTPVADDTTFVDRLAEQNVFVLPGALVDLPGYVRISLTATDAMIDQALPVFEALAA